MADQLPDEITLGWPEAGTVRKLDLAIDYDHTLDLAGWPNTGHPHPHAGWVMRRLHELGHTLIINTCREGQLLREALACLHRFNIPFDYANQNTPERIARYGGDCRKISADLYLDDKSACMSGGQVNWIDFYYEVIKLASQPE